MVTNEENNENNAMLLQMTAEIVAAYVASANVAAADLPRTITMVHASLSALDQNGGVPEPVPEVLKAAVSIRKSITPDYIICLEDGLKLRMLKRHLRTAYGLSPDEYRARWNLPSDYPMVAPSYAKQRSDFAKKIGLGQNATGRRKGSTKANSTKAKGKK
jgi:predicted transcriptional regulator